MLERVRADLLRAAGGRPLTPRHVLRLVVNEAGLQALLVHRAGTWLRDARRRPALLPLVALATPAQRLAAACVRRAFDIDLDLSADIGPGLVIYHFGGIRLRNCRIGADCEIAQEVRIEPDPGDEVGPTLGDRVRVLPHGRVVGRAEVGDDARVGAGTLVTCDVPAGAVALGDPARISRVGRKQQAG